MTAWLMGCCVGVVVLLCLGVGEGAAEPPKAGLASVAWMAGRWEGEFRGRKVEEHWMAPAGGSMLGSCRWTAQGKTVFREFLLLEETDEGLVMTVSHVGPKMAKLEEKPPTFLLESLKENEAVFREQKPEQPTRIRYRREPDGGLYARVETHRNGQPAVLEFPMKAVK